MRHRKRRVLEGSWFNLNSVTSPATGRKHYVVSANAYRLLKLEGMNIDDVRDHFDPHHNRGSKHSTSWKFRSREQAEQLLTMAILKFGG